MQAQFVRRVRHLMATVSAPAMLIAGHAAAATVQDQPAAPAAPADAARTGTVPASPATDQIAPDSTAQETAGPASAAEGEEAVQEIVVTGFRSSLQKALNIKKTEAGAVDAILAEDMADFPDLNLAESIQRLPGVTIEREAGQGRSISVRGLGADFTRVRINGIEAQAAAGGNRGRGFDFSVFASELFNSITVRKTQSAEIEEGSLGATVDLQTGRPLDFKAGFDSAVSAQASYNDLSKQVLPRIATLFSWSNEDRTWGGLISVAYSERKPTSESFNTTRWQSGNAAQSYGANQNFGGCTACTTPESRASLLNAFYPRIPRYTYGQFDEDRLGLTASLQWKPTDTTEVVIDALHSRFNQEFESPNVGVISFSRGTATGVRETIVRDFEVNDRNMLVYGVFDNVDVRSENGFDRNETEFTQVSLNAKHAFTDRFRGQLKIGRSRSQARTPTSISYQFDANNVNGYTYDFRDNDRTPLIKYGFDVADPANYTLTEFRSSESGADYVLDAIAGALAYDLDDRLTVKIGGERRNYDFSTFGRNRNRVLSPPEQIRGVDGLGKVESIDGGLKIPAGSDLNYYTPDIGKLTDALGLFENYPINPNLSSDREVTEKDTGLYAQLDFTMPFMGMTARGNFGFRYARTETASSGFLNASYVTANNAYEDYLPSANLALDVTDTLVVRFGTAKVMARPPLGNLTPGGSLNTSGQTINYGNPLLNPFRAKNVDLSAEWYFAPEALLAVAGFYKKIDSFISTDISVVPWRELGLPDSLLVGTPSSPDQDFQVTRNVNGTGGTLKGIEVQYQQPFSFLPAPFDDFGFLGNYTYVQSRVNYGTPQAPTFNRLTGQSSNIFNTTLYYEGKGFSARVSAAYRDRYLTAFPGGNGNNEAGQNGTTNIDASIRYDLTDKVSVTLEGVNLTDQFTDAYVDTTNRVSNYRHFGREILLGFRWRY